MRDIGGLVWIVFVLFAVVSSIVRSARRARAGAPATPARTRLIAQFQQQAQAVTQPRAPAPPVARAPAPPVVNAPAPVVSAPVAPRLVAYPLDAPAPEVTGFFADRRALIRGVVAAEVLGKPLALRDE